MNKLIKYTLVLVVFANLKTEVFSQNYSAEFPKYHGDKAYEKNIHDGRLPWAIGVHSYGVFRAFNYGGKTHDKDGLGYQFNHHPNLVYWKNHYWISYQGGPTDGSHGDKPRVPYLITYSANGREWEAPEVIFSSINFQGENTYMHTRMGFYVSISGRLLAVSFHGRHPSPNGGGENGVARVVREIQGINKDGRVKLGPVYAIRFNEGRTTENTGLIYFGASPDKGLVEACDELLNDKLVTQQWFEEDRMEDLYTVNLTTPNEGPNASNENVEAKAFDWYTLPSGRIIGWWKGSGMAYSDDGWKTTSKINVDYNRLGEHRTAKMWGQKLSNNKYAMVFCLSTQTRNPATEWSSARLPMVVIPSDDGISFKQNQAVIFGDNPPARYINPPIAKGLNDNRDGGPQYIRGISESNRGKPSTKEPTGNLWLTYSVNKEDIWVSEVPRNIEYETSNLPKDNFEAYNPKNLFGDWIILSPAWAPITLAKEGRNKFMRLHDKDPYEHAKAMHVFQSANSVNISLKLRPGQSDYGLVNIDITDRNGKVAARLQLDESANISVFSGASVEQIDSYSANKWIDIQFVFDCIKQQYSLTIDGHRHQDMFDFHEKTAMVERFEIRTGTYRMADYSRIGSWQDYPSYTFHDADEEVPMAIFDIDDLIIE